VIAYDSVNLGYLAEGYRGFHIVPTIEGFYMIEPIECRCEGLVEKEASAASSSIPIGTSVCSYMLLYPFKKWVIAKIGNSWPNTCISRMYRQAPPIAIVSDVLYTERFLDRREVLDLEIRKNLGDMVEIDGIEFKPVTFMRGKSVVSSWKYIVKSKLELESILKGGLKLAEIISKILDNLDLGHTLLPSPGYMWFTTFENLSEDDVKIVEKHNYVKQSKDLVISLCTKGGKVKIRHMPNGLFHIMLKERRNVLGEPVSFLLTYSDVSKLKLRVIEDG